jgi:hypothetical protein
MPARLAVGLGLESGLEISCLISFAPSEQFSEFGSPAPGFKEGSQTLAATEKVKHKSVALSN